MRGRKAELKAISGGLDGVPAVPDHLPPVMAAEWVAIAADLHRRKILTASMIGLVATYVTALWSVRQAQAAIEKHGVLIAGGHGALKPNPAVAMLLKSQEAVARLAAELGLTPAARSKSAMRPHEQEGDADAWASMDL